MKMRTGTFRPYASLRYWGQQLNATGWKTLSLAQQSESPFGMQQREKEKWSESEELFTGLEDEYWQNVMHMACASTTWGKIDSFRLSLHGTV